MRISHQSVDYDLPDEWWNASGIQEAVPSERSYFPSASPSPELPVIYLAISDVAPLVRNGSHGVFNDSLEFGTARDRVIRILTGFREKSAIPPIEVSQLPLGSLARYKLIHGAHRLYCAIAAGYSHVPAIEVEDFWGTYPSETRLRA